VEQIPQISEANPGWNWPVGSACSGVADHTVQLGGLVGIASDAHVDQLRGCTMMMLLGESGAMQPTLPPLYRLLAAAELEPRIRLEGYDDHDGLAHRDANNRPNSSAPATPSSRSSRRPARRDRRGDDAYSQGELAVRLTVNPVHCDPADIEGSAFP
jgi:hypothetical protein